MHTPPFLRGVVASLVVTLATASLSGVAAAQTQQHFTLDQVLEFASSQGPAISADRLRVDEARAPLLDARPLFNSNPEIAISAAPWRTPAGSPARGVPLELEIEQRFGLPGVRSARIRSGRARVRTAKAGSADFERGWLLVVSSDFLGALAASEEVDILAADEDLARTLLEIARLRVDKGADAPLSLSAARIRLAESQRKLLQGQVEQRAATRTLAAHVGLPPGDSVIPDGTLYRASIELPEVEVLVTQAVASRPDLLALDHSIEGAAADLSLARRSAWPELALGARYEALDAKPLTLGTVGLQIPLFSRNQGDRGASAARASRLELQRRAATLAVEAQVRTAWDRRETASRALDLYDSDVIAAFDDSLAMLTRMFDAGKVDYGQVVALQRERLDGQLGFVAARLDLALADVELRAAVGLPLLAVERATRDFGQYR